MDETSSDTETAAQRLLKPDGHLHCASLHGSWNGQRKYKQGEWIYVLFQKIVLITRWKLSNTAGTVHSHYSYCIVPGGESMQPANYRVAWAEPIVCQFLPEIPPPFLQPRSRKCPRDFQVPGGHRPGNISMISRWLLFSISLFQSSPTATRQILLNQAYFDVKLEE